MLNLEKKNIVVITWKEVRGILTQTHTWSIQRLILLLVNFWPLIRIYVILKFLNLIVWGKKRKKTSKVLAISINCMPFSTRIVKLITHKMQKSLHKSPLLLPTLLSSLGILTFLHVLLVHFLLTSGPSSTSTTPTQPSQIIQTSQNSCCCCCQFHSPMAGPRGPLPFHSQFNPVKTPRIPIPAKNPFGF